ncbi:MAG: flippase-like domain-containing protein [Lentimicrobiaceae bacterium]|nr:flippase-like domain-containing protein [Lentimicrobiaceae bacterium]MCB9023264.1 flippase-like domain-containing protein [Lentimicrobiaceae bacterium]MCO5266925.1 flippase-like domain-containing protein [Lentimicrobium sp.]
MPGYLKAFLKIALSVAALYYVYTKIDLQEVLSIFSSVHYGWLLAATVMFVVSKVFSSFRLNVFFANINSALTGLSNLKLYLLGMYYNLFLPGGIGGDGYKIYLLNKLFKVKAKKLFWAVLLDRVNGVLALFVLAMVMVPFIPIPMLYKYLAISAIPVSIAVYYIVIKYFFKDFYSGVNKTNLQSLAVQVFQIVAAWFILYANNNQDNTISYLFLFLISSIVATLPITIGGIGSREITFLFGAEIMHLDIHQSIALSLLFYLITAFVSLIGIYYSLNEKALNLQLSDNSFKNMENT